LQELWKYRELFYFLALRDVKVRYKQTALGVLWAIFQPLFTMLIFTILFGRLVSLERDTGIPASVFYMSGLLPWLYFTSTLNQIGNSLVSNVNLVKKVYFPRAILPGAVAVAGILDLSIGTVLLGLLLLYHGVTFTWTMLLWPLLTIPLAVLALGVGMFLAALNVKYRDVKHAIPFFIRIGIFVTPVIWPVRIIPERFHNLLALNPMFGLVETFRFSVNPARDMNWEAVGLSLVMVVALFLGGLMYFRKAERTFADVI
jgi:lipopolysaccharide transport system permease protein